jgi:putative transposase
VEPPVEVFCPVKILIRALGLCLVRTTRAINKQEGWSGSIFRQETKAKNGWIDEFITVDKYQKGNFDFRTFPDNDYGFECFNYIHNNPVKAAITNRATEWKYSSAMDFAGMRSGTLCNQKLARELLLLP